MIAPANKDNRIDIRVKNAEKNFLLQAAAMRNMKLSAFILNSALKEAEEVTASQRHFSLSAAVWKKFCNTLDQPTRTIPKLKKLFTAPGVFDGP